MKRLAGNTLTLGVVALTYALSVAPTSATAAEEVHFINCGSGEGAMPELLASHIAEWEADNPDYSVRVEFLPWEQCQSKTITLARAGDPPAISFMGSRVLKQLAQSELIVPIELTEEEANSYEPSVLRSVRFDDAIWGLPRASSTKALYYNKSILEQAGIATPDKLKTFDDVVRACEAVVEQTAARCMGLTAGDTDSTVHQFLNWLYSNGGSVVDDEGNITFDSPQTTETFAFYAEMAKYAQDGPIAYTRRKLRPLFAEEQIAMYVGGAWSAKRFSEIDFAVTFVPSGPSGEHSTLLITDSITVFANTGVEQASLDLVKFLTTVDRQSAIDEAGSQTPLRNTSYSQKLLDADPNWSYYLDTIANAGIEPSFIDYQSMEDAIISAVQGVVLGEISPEEATKEAAAELQKLAEAES